MSSDTSLDYRDQVGAIRQNDEKSLRDLYQSNYPKVERYVLENSGTTDEAKDIYQEAFISLWRNIQLDRFQPQHEASVDAYLFQIAKNKWLDHLRSVKKKHTVQLTDNFDQIEEIEEPGVNEQQQLKNIKKHFRQLGIICKEVLGQFYFYRQSMRTIAEKQNWTEATARNNKYRCLQQLRKLINAKNIAHG